MLSHIVNGFKAIHSVNVVHRDIKLANILIHFNSLSIEQIIQSGDNLYKYKKGVNLLEDV